MSVDEKSLVSLTRGATKMADLGRNDDQTKKTPRYYEGVYTNDRTISTNGNVTPDLLRSPISRGLFHLPRYVPKYTINSRLHGKYADDTFSDSKTSRTFNRKYKDGKDVDSDYFKEVPIYRDSPDGVEGSNSDKKDIKKSKEGRKKTKKNAESEQRKTCCSKCCSAERCTPKCCRCCSVECCTPKCRRCACIFVIVALVAAALLALALGLYFGYFEQFGDAYPMKANFTVTNATYPGYLTDLTNPNTINLTNSICGAFMKTLENVSQIYVDVSSCSAVSYTNGSINALFNIDVRHRRDQFTNSEDVFLKAVRNRVTEECRPDPVGYFAEAVSNSVLSGDRTGVYFNVVLNDFSPGHFSAPVSPSTSTVTSTPTTTKSITTNSISATKTLLKNIATSAGNSAAANMNGNATDCGNNTVVSLDGNSTASGCGNNTGDATIPGNSTNTTPNVSAAKCGNSTANETNCGNNTSVTAGSVLNTTISSIGMRTTEPGPTSAAKVSSTAIIPSSIRTDSPTTTKPFSTKATQPSSTQSPTVQPSSTKNPTIQPSSTQNPTMPPTSTTHRTTTVFAPVSTSTLHLDVTKTATPSATTSAANIRQATTSERSTSGSTSHAALASSSK